MKVSKIILSKVEEYQKMRYDGDRIRADALYLEIREYFEHKCKVKNFLQPFTVNVPLGRRITLDGEFHIQANSIGIHYFRVRGSKKYVAYNYFAGEREEKDD